MNLHSQTLLKARAAFAAGSVFILALLVLILGLPEPLNLYDDGIVLVGAERVLAGELPYRDFWVMYAPAQFYWLASLFALFGPSDVVARVAGYLVKALIVLVAWWWLRRQLPSWLAWVGAIAVLLVLAAVGFELFPVFPALLLICLALGLLPDSDDSRLRQLSAGLLLGVATLFRHDLGFYACACVMLWRILLLLDVHERRLALFLRALLYPALGVVLVVLPATLMLLLYIPVADLWFSLIYAPAVIYPEVRGLPFPPLVRSMHELVQSLELLVWMPAVTLILGAFCLRRRHQLHTPAAKVLLLLLCMVLLFALKGVVRISAVHLVQSLVPACMLLVMIAGLAGSRLHRAAAAAVLVLFMLAPLSLNVARLQQGMNALADGTHALFSCQGVSPGRQCLVVDPDYRWAAEQVMRMTSEGQRIYVGISGHDRIFVSGVALYFMVGRLPATIWHELHPGVQTSRQVQERMREEFIRQPPALLVLDSRWQQIEEPNLSAHSTGERVLDDYLHEHYQVVARHNSMAVLQPRTDTSGVAGPADESVR